MRVAIAMAMMLAACAGSPAPRADTIVGITSPDQIEALPSWREAIASATPDEDASAMLADVPPGAHIDVFVGTWCSDSRREVARLFRALERIPRPYPFTIRWIGVDRAKVAHGLTEGVGLRFVPTFIVRRNGQEMGRIVEMAPRGIERELLDLLMREAAGSAR